MKGLIIEGVAGTGKSSLLTLLKKDETFLARFPRHVFIEEETTTGDLVRELRDPSRTDEDRFERLHHLLPLIKRHMAEGKFVVLERFHPTFFALMPETSLVEHFDLELAKLGFGLVLLDLPNEELEARSFHRPEMRNQNWEQGLARWYGSKDDAIEAFIASQEARRRYLTRTKLKSLRITTSGMDWGSYLKEILEFTSDSSLPTACIRSRDF